MAAVPRLIVALFVWLVAGSAFAAFPATPVNPGSCTVAPCVEYSLPNANMTWHATRQAACAQRVANLQVSAPSEAPWVVLNALYGTGGAQCLYRNKNGTEYSGAYTTRTVPPVTAEYTCPANSTLSGSSCTCTSPYVQNSSNTGCEAPPDPQEELCNALSGTETYASGPGNIAPGASSCNATGCMTTFANTLIRVRNAQGQYVTEGAATFTGGTCTYSEITGTAEDTCPGGASGQVNGVTVCVPYDGTENTIETVGESESTSTEGDTTTSTSTTSTTTCSNGSCTTTTNVTTNVNGGTPTTKTTTTAEPQDEFCRKNPTATQCKENGSFTGNCNSSFVCKGDAIQCATAKAANEQLCKFKDMLEMDTATRALVDKVLAGTWEKNPKDEPRTENLGSFDQSNPLSGACPGDIAISIATVSVVIPLGSFCPQLQMMGNLLVAFTLLSATVFVFRGTA